VSTHFDLGDGRVGPRERAGRQGIGFQSINRLAVCGGAYDAANGSAVHHARNAAARHDSVSDRRVEDVSRDSYQVLRKRNERRHLKSWANAFHSAILFHYNQFLIEPFVKNTDMAGGVQTLKRKRHLGSARRVRVLANPRNRKTPTLGKWRLTIRCTSALGEFPICQTVKRNLNSPSRVFSHGNHGTVYDPPSPRFRTISLLCTARDFTQLLCTEASLLSGVFVPLSTTRKLQHFLYDAPDQTPWVSCSFLCAQQSSRAGKEPFQPFSTGCSFAKSRPL
jgi:hypothetical protein